MALYAIGDLHLATTVNKPMDVFGDTWTNHTEQIQQHWTATISPSDTVLIPGDISWAMTLDEAAPDLQWVSELPGKKVMIRGNHDYWWSGIGKVRGILLKDMYAIQNDSLPLDGLTIAGTRGWVLPNHPNFSEEDEHILQREIHRLKLSLDHAVKHNHPIVCMLHYPPTGGDGEETVFTQVLESYGVQLCVYGHLHGASHRFAFNGTRNGTRYQLVSADYLQFKPFALGEINF
ncbi:ser/threonine protein phosphatase [Alicyclobacillus acidoterrestris]|uniref:metallophosphoesterase n=1 Tax=Alicyclobacillus suci TaxID=2816080 RepID=UPI00118F7D0E|nr:metallophosphoesterase [Alicyclobacillus suci]GEO25712.1 ser/threonine protein phosphatase [Alicyclobacillus acidoterrestris]